MQISDNILDGSKIQECSSGTVSQLEFLFFSPFLLTIQFLSAPVFCFQPGHFLTSLHLGIASKKFAYILTLHKGFKINDSIP
jgi:hypothetical protein